MNCHTKEDERKNLVGVGIQHLAGHIERILDVGACLKNLREGSGDRLACVEEIKLHASATAMLAWFARADVADLKQSAFVASKTCRYVAQSRPQAVPSALDYLMLLVSDCEQLIQWFSNFEIPFSNKGFYSSPSRTARPNTPDFTSYQVLLALRGNWTELERRSNLFLSEMPKTRKSYVADQRFHLALAHGDVSAMESALAEMLDPALMKRRRDKDESGYTQWFISTYAVIYSKIAWRHGYQVEVDSPWVPKEWLPVAPLPCYEDPYRFLKEFDINTPIEV